MENITKEDKETLQFIELELAKETMALDAEINNLCRVRDKALVRLHSITHILGDATGLFKTYHKCCG